MTDLNKATVSEKSGNIVLPRGRFWFCAVAEKFTSKEDKAKGKDGAYVITTCIPPTANLDALVTAVKAKAVEKFGAKLPGNLKSPIRRCKDVFDKNGDPKYPAEMADWYQVTANTFKQQPGVVDAKGNPLSKLLPGESTDDVKARLEEECYSGRWGSISVNPSAYDTDGNRGIKLYLQNVQVLDHGEKLGGRGAKAEDDFVPVEVAGAGATASAGSADSVFG
jgi:hypothetical protein